MIEFRRGSKPLPEPVLTYIPDAYMRRYREMSYINYCGLVTNYGEIDMDQDWLR